MAKLIVFNNISLDGYFTGADGDLSWAHTKPDPEWDAFVRSNASNGGRLLMGRKTYERMSKFWPTPEAAQQLPELAAHMNRLQKIVFSKTLTQATWQNTTLRNGGLAAEVRQLKGDQGLGICILGSGSIVAQLTQERLIDEYQFVVVPIILGQGRTMFEGVKDRPALKLLSSQAFKNGNVVLKYASSR